jgi:probable rRNA maturation factor
LALSTIRILIECDLIAVPEDAVRRMARRILDQHECKDKELSVVFTDDKSIKMLNRDFLGRDRPTNVISFSQQGVPGDIPSFENRLLGDVVVSVETCLRHAREAGIEPLEEAVFCLIHGIAHLLGYDHEGVEEEAVKKMEEFEMDIFRRYGPIVFGDSAGSYKEKSHQEKKI